MTSAVPTPPSPNVPAAKPHIAVCVCTYQRPVMLQRLLEAVEQQVTNDAFSISVVVADNDAARSAEGLVKAWGARSRYKITYCSEPTKNIALVRNKAVETADGDYIAFIDDDEFPVANWLSDLLRTCDQYSAAGVLGPVRPHFETPPPAWLIKGRFCERPEQPTGTEMEWAKCRTGNVLFKSAITAGETEVFRREFGTGGEDQDFFRRMSEKGCVFVWCNEAIAYETVPPNRWTRSFMFKRALLRGRNSLRHPKGRIRLIAQSCIAVPLYTLFMPVALIIGQHVFVKVCVKFLDHFGRLLTLARLNPVEERQM